MAAIYLSNIYNTNRTSKYDTAIELGLYGLDNTWGNNGETKRTVRWFYKKTTDSIYTQYTETTILSNKINSSDDYKEYITIYGLTPGTTYQFKAEIYYNNNSTYLTTIQNSDAIATTYPSAPAIYFDDITSNSATLTLQSSGKVSKYNVEVKQGSTTILNKIIYTTSTSKLVYSLTGLSAGTTYTVWAYGILDLNGSNYYSTAYTANNSFTTTSSSGGEVDPDGYNVTLYFTPSHIDRIGIESWMPDGMSSGSVAKVITSSDTSPYSVTVPQGETLSVFAITTGNYEFSHWSYGGVDGVTTYNNSLEYVGGKDIVITCVSSARKWVLCDEAYDYGGDIYVQEGKIYTWNTNPNFTYDQPWVSRIILWFSYEGIITITSQGKNNLETETYLTTDGSFSENTGKPTGYLSDQDNDNNSSHRVYHVQPNQLYYLYMKFVNAGECYAGYGISVNIDATQRIEKFYWNSTEESAFSNNGKTIALTYTRWNELCDKVKKVIDHKGDSWDNYHANLASTKATASGEAITAKQFNSLRYNIDSKCTGVAGTGIENKKGKTIYSTRDGTQIGDPNNPDIVYGQYFLDIVTVLNNWIDSL